MIPGTSRSGATIVGALLMGADKRSAAEFSFFLAMPTMVYQRLSPATTRLVELIRLPAADLNQRAMTLPDSGS